jgi:hypothetical protein
MTTFGINQDGDGNVVGLWFDPERAVHDEHIYVTLTPGELMSLVFDNDELAMLAESLRTAIGLAAPGIYATQGADPATMTRVYRHYGDLCNLEERVAAAIRTEVTT